MGKTTRVHPTYTGMGKHPHARGEDSAASSTPFRQWETPPRTWGRHDVCDDLRFALRNTPTHVGKTQNRRYSVSQIQKHPHARGEDKADRDQARHAPETPPRTWGRRSGVFSTSALMGNTPTHVGKTSGGKQWEMAIQKHPHARGEDPSRRPTDERGLETPPRTWGRQLENVYFTLFSRNTPTHVGKTSLQVDSRSHHGKHPHARGED